MSIIRILNERVSKKIHIYWEDKGVISIFNRLSTKTVNWIFIIGIILFIMEIVFFHGSLIISAAILGFLAFMGWKNYTANWGKILFWVGLIGLIITILNMIAIRFLVIVFLILFLIDYSKTKNMAYLHPEHNDDAVLDQEEPVVEINPLFKQMLYGDQKTSQSAYEWQDIHIQGGIGDRVIDISNTVLPNDTAIISIRHGVGNITIYIPYDVEFMIHHSAIFGRAYILHKRHIQLMNQHVSYKTEQYNTAKTKVKIITSLLSGNIEVKRI